MIPQSSNARRGHQLFADMSKVNGGLLFLFAALRVGDLAIHGKLKYLGGRTFKLRIRVR